MPRRYVTETIKEKVPILMCCREGEFGRKISKLIEEEYTDFSVLSVHDDDISKLGLTVPPYLQVWVVETVDEFEKNEKIVRSISRQFDVRMAVIAKEGTGAGRRVQQEFPLALCIITNTRTRSEKLIRKIVAELFSVERKGETVVLSDQDDEEEKTPHHVTPHNVTPHHVEPPSPTPSSEFSNVNVSSFESAQIAETKVPAQFFLEREEPEILKPPPALFSHLPVEHSIATEVATKAVVAGVAESTEVPVKEAQVDSGGGVTEKNESIIQSLFAKKTTKTPIPNAKKAKNETVRQPQTDLLNLSKRKKSRATPLKAFLAISILFLAIPTVFIASIFYAKQTFIQAFTHFQDTFFASTPDMQLVADEAQTLSKKTALVRNIQSVAGSVINLVNADYGEDLDQILTLSEKEISTVGALQQFSSSVATTYLNIIGKETGDAFVSIEKNLSEVGKASKEVSLLSAEVVNLKTNALVQKTALATGGSKKLSAMGKDLLAAQYFLGRLPNMLGQEKKKTYLVLIQNPLELRPTGGFLSAYGLITVEKGTLLDIQTQDTYVADNELKGKVDPPNDLTKYLSEQQWYFRDSNWSADFPTTANQAEWFVEKELGIVPDGTIGMNIYTLQSMLEAVGPVEVKTYGGELVSAENIFERVQSHSELTISAKGEKRKEYLTSLAEEIFAKVRDVDASGAQKLGTALMHSLESGNLQLSVRDFEDEQTLDLLGWNGKIMTPPCPQQFVGNQCYVDTVYEVDTNVGINRANYYVKKSVNHAVVLASDAAAHTYTMRFTNSAVSSAWPAGKYRNYIRLYVPDYAQINSVVVDEKPLSANSLVQTDEFGKTMVGFLVEVPVGGTVVATVNYSTILSGEKGFSYAVFTQKQPGSEAYPVSFSLHVQKPLVVKTLAPEGNVVGNVIQIDNSLDKHQYMAVEVDR